MRLVSCISCFLALFSCKKDFSHLETQVFGHAGISLEPRKAEFYPNHFGDVQYALQQTDLDGTEIDVQMTADGELVLFHDQELDENSNLSGCIPEMTWQELQIGTFYNTIFPITKLSEAIVLLKFVDKTLLLDVKHHNSCANENIDFNLFNEKFNQVIADLDEEEKSRIIVNCRKLDLLQTLTDTTIQKSLESDDAEYALQVMEQNNINILVIKLEAMNEEIKSQLNQQGYSLGIYNVKTRKENNKALGFAPDFVISDNIDCTLKSVNGKE